MKRIIDPAKLCKSIIYAALFASFILLAVYFSYYAPSLSDISIILLSDENNAAELNNPERFLSFTGITIRKDGTTTGKKLGNYSFNYDRLNKFPNNRKKLFNLVSSCNGNLFFVDIAENLKDSRSAYKEWLTFSLKFNHLLKNVEINNSRKINKLYYSEGKQPLGISSDFKTILFTDSIFSIPENKFIAGFGKTEIDRKHESMYPISSSLLNDDSIVCQFAAQNSRNSDLVNTLYLFSRDGSSVLSKCGTDTGQPPCRLDGFTPLELLNDGRKVAFLSNFKRGDIQTCLNIWNPDKNRTETIASFPHLLIDRGVSIKSNRSKNSDLLAFYSGYVLKSLFIFDTNTHKLVTQKEINITLKSMRWSPDGKKIGLLAETGELWLYDSEKDTLKIADQNMDNFDFFWVE